MAEYGAVMMPTAVTSDTGKHGQARTPPEGMRYEVVRPIQVNTSLSYCVGDVGAAPGNMTRVSFTCQDAPNALFQSTSNWVAAESSRRLPPISNAK